MHKYLHACFCISGVMLRDRQYLVLQKCGYPDRCNFRVCWIIGLIQYIPALWFNSCPFFVEAVQHMALSLCLCGYIWALLRICSFIYSFREYLLCTHLGPWTTPFIISCHIDLFPTDTVICTTTMAFFLSLWLGFVHWSREISVANYVKRQCKPHTNLVGFTF